MATTAVNGGPPSNSEVNSANLMPNVGKQGKPASGTAGNKNADSSRKMAGSGTTSDAPQRYNAAPKAWTSGKNPITQRSNTPGQSNGAGPQPQSTSKASTTQELNSPSKLANHDRFLWLMATSIGQPATITTASQDSFSGIFWGASMDGDESAYLFKMVRQIKNGEKGQANGVQENATAYLGVGEEHDMTFNVKDIIELAVDGIQSIGQDRHQNGSTAAFRTDADISGNFAPRERQLQPWIPAADTDADLSLEGPASAVGKPWDQFEANEQLFGLKSDYNEDYYTTTINRASPAYRETEAKAQRIAREIEASASSDAHVREERGVADENNDLDEESKYSGVRRNGADYPPLQFNQPNRYMPPGRRPLSGKPSTADAPVDPAIISSQIARSEVIPQGGSNPALKPAVNGTASANTVTESKQEGPKDIPISTVNATDTSRPADTPKAPSSNATSNVDAEDALAAFKSFANTEKSRITEDRRRRAVHDKAIKLNDLKKFSSNFKLHTPVPKDLVPILAKDKTKQQEIMEKAQRETEQKAALPQKTPASSADQASSKAPDESKTDGIRAPPNTANASRQEYNHGRQGLPPRGPQAGVSSRDKQQQFTNVFPASAHGGQGMLSHRLADQHNRHKAGMQVTVPTPLPIHTVEKANSRPVPSSQASSTVRTPTSAISARLNVNAIEFKPNPTANVFKLAGGSSPTPSPRSNSNIRPTSRAPTPSDFFGSKKPLPPGDKPSIMEHFNPLKRLKEKAQKENKVKDYASNGGIVYAHSTPVTWSQAKNDEDFKSYKDMYEDVPAQSRGATPHQPAASPNGSALMHQLPASFQHAPPGVPHVPATQQPSYHGPPQPHHYPAVSHHFDDQRMHPSPSANSAYPTPRGSNYYFAFPTPPMGQPAQYAHAQPVAPYGMPPGGHQAQNFGRMPSGPPFAPSPGQHYAVPMMAHNSSQGGFMGPQTMHAPQVQMFAHGQAPPYGAQAQPMSGYPSPGHGGGTPMMQQGSYQGQNTPMHMAGPQYGGPVYAPQHPPSGTPLRSFASPQQHYNQSPQQQPHFPHQISRAPSNNYNHFPQGQYPPMQGQHPAPPNVPMEGGEAMK
ncbi:hypothetical protein P7C71_g2136, partial [Lecanoromycetidae sp. Uapishka_2]